MFKKIGFGILAVTLLAGVASVGAALAQEPTPSTEASDGVARRALVREGAGGPGGPGGPGGSRGGQTDLVAEALGMTPEELHEVLADGQTVADVAEAQGVALEDVADALVAAHTEQIQQAVEDGRLTQEEADEKIAELGTQVLEHLESGELRGPEGPGGPSGPGGPGRPRGGQMDVADIDRASVAEALGMTPEELHEALADGQTVADVAEAQGVALEDVADALVAAHTEQIQQGVEDGRLTQEQADERIAELGTQVLEHLESGECGGRGGPGGMRRGPRGGGLGGPRSPEMAVPAVEG